MLLLVTAAVSLLPPTFPTDFYSGIQTYQRVNKGGATFLPGGAACCNKMNSSQCSLETVNLGQDTWQSSELKMHRFGSVVNNYTVNTHGAEMDGRQMAVAPAREVAKYANSSHKWVCMEYCPLTSGSFYDLIEIGTGRKVDAVSFLGNHTVTQREGPSALAALERRLPCASTAQLHAAQRLTSARVLRHAAPGHATKTTSEFHWKTHLFGRVLGVNNMFVDFSGEAPVPFLEVVQALPATGGGSGGFMTDGNQSYLQFTPMDTSSYFDIDPDSYEHCEVAPQCQPQDGAEALSASGLPPHLRLTGLRSPARAERARQTPPPTPLAEPHSGKDATPPTIASDYTATVERYLLAPAGPVTETATQICCEPTAVGSCQIMLAHSHGLEYHDATNQRVRTEDTISGRVFVDFLHDHTMPTVSMRVNVTHGVETCQEWCPLSPSDRVGNFTPWATRNKGAPFVDHGKASILKTTAEHYSWKQGLIHLGVYSQYNFYADTSEPSAAKPLLLRETVSMLGRFGSDHNTTYTGFVGGTPPASKFKIANGPNDGCPKSPNCGSEAWQAHRLHRGQLATHAMFA